MTVQLQYLKNVYVGKVISIDNVLVYQNLAQKIGISVACCLFSKR